MPAPRNLDGKCAICGATVKEHLIGGGCRADMGPPDGSPTCGKQIPGLANRHGIPLCQASPEHDGVCWVWARD